MSANLIIGSSHALHFSKAIGDYSATVDEAKNNLIKIDSVSGADTYLLYAMPKPDFVHLKQTGGDSWEVTYGPPMDEIRKFNTADSKVVFMLGGNEPNGYFFYKNPKPFDVYHPGHPETDPRKQILPLAQVRTIVSRLLAKSTLSTRALAKQLPLAKKYYIAPPPPIPSDDHIRKYPEIFDFETHGIEDKNVRLKIYLIQTQFMSEICKNNGLEFLGAVPSNTDNAGFLAEEYWEGCTHASATYYVDIVKGLSL
jgi:hypothetical protein